MLLDLDFGLLLHVIHHARAGHFALETGENEADALADVEALQHLLLVGDAQIHIRGGEIRETSRVGDVHLEDLRHLVGNAVHQFGERLRGRDGARHQLIELRGVRGRFLRALHLRDGVRFQLVDRIDGDAAQPLQRDLHRFAGQIDALVHAGGHTDPADEPGRVYGVVAVTVGDDEGYDQPGFLMGPQQGQVLRGPHLHGDRPQRVDDRRAQRHERQRGGQLRAEDLFLSLAAGHGDGGMARIL